MVKTLKTYSFSGKYKKINRYEKYYTNYDFIKRKVVPIIKKLQKKGKVARALHFIDTSAGDGRLHDILKKNNVIKTYKSYDISPPAKNFKVEKKNWLKHATKTSKNTLIGFNPPYGYNNKKAKEFIKNGWDTHARYAIWLVPKSMSIFLQQYYKKISETMYNSLSFQNKTKKNNKVASTINQSVILFIGKRLETPKILSKSKSKKTYEKYDYIVSRSHYKGIEKDVTLIIKKTGNPVLMPIFIKKGKYWHQYYNGDIVTKTAKMVKNDGHYFMKGISRTKKTEKPFLYAVESNVYFKIKNLEKKISLKKLAEELMKLNEKQSFYNLTNIYKPASVTKEWFVNYLNKYIDERQ